MASPRAAQWSKCRSPRRPRTADADWSSWFEVEAARMGEAHGLGGAVGDGGCVVIAGEVEHDRSQTHPQPYPESAPASTLRVETPSCELRSLFPSATAEVEPRLEAEGHPECVVVPEFVGDGDTLVEQVERPMWVALSFDEAG